MQGYQFVTSSPSIRLSKYVMNIKSIVIIKILKSSYGLYSDPVTIKSTNGITNSQIQQLKYRPLRGRNHLIGGKNSVYSFYHQAINILNDFNLE